MYKKEELIKLAERCSEVLKDKYWAKGVFLTGSLVKGYFHEWSDIDIVVEGLLPEFYIFE